MKCSPAANLPEIMALNETVAAMKGVLDKLQCEMVDVVNNIEILNNSRKQPETPKVRAAYPNPKNIPGYDMIDVIEVAQVHAPDVNESVTSIDELVPDLENPTDTATDLNYSVQTNQLK